MFPDISYGFYTVFAQLYGIKAKTVPLKEDFTIDPADYYDAKGAMVVIANPNAPTGLILPLTAIEQIVQHNPDSVVLIDEAYVDFGGESAIPLTKKYDNLLVVQTFSKSRSLAGARLGYAIGNASLIADLNKIRCSTNPYNVNRLTLAAGEAAIDTQPYYTENCKRIIETREKTAAALREMHFTVTDSRANFLFAKSDRISGEKLYLALKERGILVRHFTSPRIAEYNRITVGAPEEMQALLSAVRDILGL
jgi:histidinol-phosphate aminotransferase